MNTNNKDSEMKSSEVAAVLREALRWAESKCPCRDETPDPCTLCGVSVASLEPCKAADATLPRTLLADIRAALASTEPDASTPQSSKKEGRYRFDVDDENGGGEVVDTSDNTSFAIVLSGGEDDAKMLVAALNQRLAESRK